MKKIFISYRRQDTRTIAGRIVDHLEARYGRDAVLIDIESIPPGVDFQDWLQDQIASASIVIALIGPGWTNARDERGKRRLDSSGDFVRMELEAAIARKIPLIPLLIDGALTPPARELPASLRPLTRRNAAFLDPGRDFNSHITRLIGAIDRHLNEDESATPALGTKAGSSSAIMVSAKPALYEDPAECLIRTFIGHAGEVYSVAISPDGRFALSGAQDGSLKLWDMNSGREIKSFWGT